MFIYNTYPSYTLTPTIDGANNISVYNTGPSPQTWTANVSTSNANDVIFMVGSFSARETNAVLNISSTSGLNWIQAGNVTDATGFQWGYTTSVWYAVSPNALSNEEITISIRGPNWGFNYTDFVVFGVSGANTISPVESLTISNGVNSPIVLSQVAANTLVIAAYQTGGYNQNTITSTVGDGFTALSNANNYLGIVEYAVVSNTTNNFTANVNNVNPSIINSIVFTIPGINYSIDALQLSFPDVMSNNTNPHIPGMVFISNNSLWVSVQ